MNQELAELRHDVLRLMKDKGLSKEYLQSAAVMNSRALRVLAHILQHGSVSTYELQKQYGYSHPPRARQDVQDGGIPLKTTQGRNPETGRPMAVYSLDLTTGPDSSRAGGRRPFPRNLKAELAARQGKKCQICQANFNLRQLQIDHRVPYQISGELPQHEWTAENLMLICSSCNRNKSFDCEHECPNWDKVDPDTCRTCYWFGGSDHKHVATQPIRRLTLSWQEDEVELYEAIAREAEREDTNPHDLVKERLVERYGSAHE